MNKKISGSAIVTVMLLVLTGLAFAGDSGSFYVSCTIPLIPGVNAPLIEEETVKTQKDTTVQQNTEPQSQPQETAPEQIQQEDKTTNDNSRPLVLVKTLYDR